jgi:hypothetical protein
MVQGLDLDPKFTVTSPPDSAYLSGTEAMWPRPDSRKQIFPLLKGEKILMYFRFIKNDAAADSIRTFTATFYPLVDDYTQMTIPNSYARSNIGYELLNTLASSQNQVNATAVMYYAGRYLEIPFKRISLNRFGQTFYVPGRTILVTLNNG